MAATAQDLLIRIDASTELLRRELKQADTAVERSSSKMSRSLTQVDASFSKLNFGAKRAADGVTKAMGALGVAISGAAIVQGMGNVLTHLQQIDRTAQGLGASVETVQELTYTFRQFGVGADDVTEGLAQLSGQAVGALDGSKSLIDIWGKLGITVDQLRDKDPAELFRLLADGVAQAKNPTEALAAASTLLGEDLAGKLIPLLKLGTQGLDQYAKKARAANQVVGEEGVKAGSRAATALQNLQAALSGTFTQVVAQNSEGLADALERATDAVSDPGVQQAVVDISTKAVNFVTHMATALKLLHQAITDVESIKLPKATSVAEGVLKQIIDDVPGLGQLYKSRTGVSLFDQIESVLSGKGHITAESAPGSVQTMPTMNVRASRLPAKPGDGAKTTTPLEVPTLQSMLDESLFDRYMTDDFVEPSIPGLGTVEEAKARAAAITEANMTALERYKIGVTEAQRLFEHGFLNEDQFARQTTALKEQFDSLNPALQEFQQMGLAASNAIASGFSEAIVEGKNLGDTFKSLAGDISQMIVKQMLFNAISRGLSHLPGMGGTTNSAQGNVFDQQGLVPFARGGIVTQPTVFPFARGVGLMGEAGPEAILPLKRIGGDLGVKAVGGGGPTVNFTQHIDARGADRQSVTDLGRIAQQMPGIVTSVIAQDIARDGPIARSLRR